MRSHRTRSAGLAPCEGAQPAIWMAWAWWPIIPDTKCTSALAGAGTGALGDTAAWGAEGPGQAPGAMTPTNGVFIRPKPAPAMAPRPRRRWRNEPRRGRGGLATPANT